jgi:hypothetical protein
MDLKQIFNLLRFIILMIAIVIIGIAYLTCSSLKANLIGFHEPFDIHDSFHHYSHEAEIREDIEREMIMRAVDASEEDKRIQKHQNSEVKPSLKELIQEHCNSEKDKAERRKIDAQIRDFTGSNRRGTYEKASKREHNVRDRDNQRERDRNPLGKD